MPNPFTRFIDRSDPGTGFARFVAGWDTVEELLVAVYRSRAASPEDERQWAEVRNALRMLYPEIEGKIKPYLRERSDRSADPVSTILDLGTAGEMIGNRRILQLLPDVREAINLSLLAD